MASNFDGVNPWILGTSRVLLLTCKSGDPLNQLDFVSTGDSLDPLSNPDLRLTGKPVPLNEPDLLRYRRVSPAIFETN